MTRSAAARTAAILAAITIAVCAAVFFTSVNEVNRVRGDFCAWTKQHYLVDLGERQTAARIADERSDGQLEQKLGC